MLDSRLPPCAAAFRRFADFPILSSCACKPAGNRHDSPETYLSASKRRDRRRAMKTAVPSLAAARRPIISTRVSHQEPLPATPSRLPIHQRKNLSSAISRLTGPL